ncbi:MAG: peroxidase-related enzyme [Gammaproteobacteria bacterium]|nr:peroxidase-related enzyme [Gammaproteobacteria bacterium]
MSWIHEVDEQNASGELARIYADLKESRGKVANIMKVHSLNPGAMERHLDLYIHLLFGPGGLSRGEREMIAVVVSRSNRCDYCVSHHAEALSRYMKQENLLHDIVRDYREAALPARQRVMLDYASQLTISPEHTSADDIARLRDAGFADADILHINLITAYFNFVNRIALGLGVSFSSDEVQGYKV